MPQLLAAVHERDSEHISSIYPVTGRSSEDALRIEKHSVLEKKRPFVDEYSSLSGREPGRPRPVSWHPSTPVEPPLNSTQLRPIGVDSILNPPARAPSVSASSAETGREGFGDQFSTSPSDQHLPSPSTHANRLSSSPGMRSRQIIIPVSPSARFVSSGFGYLRKASASQSPLVQETQPGTYTVAPGSPLPVDSVTGQPMSVSGHQQPVPVSVHSTPTFHSRRTSVNPTPNPSPQETSPTTPISTFSQFGRSSPAATPASGSQPAPSHMHSTPHTTMEPVSRLPSVIAGHKHVNEEPVVLHGFQPESPPEPGMIPCILDLKSGSSSQAEKRKANRYASMRFRNRKRNELQMEQKITAQQDEIRKQTEALQRQAQEIQALMQERDFYRSERDLYREHVGRLVPSGQILARPTSPRSFQHSDRDHQAWPSTDTTQRVMDPSGLPPPASATRSAGSWTSRGTLADEQQARSLPQSPGPWT